MRLSFLVSMPAVLCLMPSLRLMAQATSRQVFADKSVERNSVATQREKARSRNTATATLLGGINKAVLEGFRKAWRVSGGGTAEIEGAVLLYRGIDGTIAARSLGLTNQRLSFTIVCDVDVIAIVHTHPNKCNAQPEGADLEIADHLRIPVFTITNRGMFMYDPGTKKISKVQDGLNWMDPAKWIQVRTWQPHAISNCRMHQ